MFSFTSIQRIQNSVAFICCDYCIINKTQKPCIFKKHANLKESLHHFLQINILVKSYCTLKFEDYINAFLSKLTENLGKQQNLLLTCIMTVGETSQLKNSDSANEHQKCGIVAVLQRCLLAVLV